MNKLGGHGRSRFRDDRETHLLREIMRVQQLLVLLSSREVGISGSKLALLRLLATAPEGKAGVMDMARRLGINASAVTRQVRELEKERWLERKHDKNDLRRNYVCLTAKGRRIFRDFHEMAHRFEEKVEKELGKKETASATGILAKLRRFLENIS